MFRFLLLRSTRRNISSTAGFVLIRFLVSGEATGAAALLVLLLLETTAPGALDLGWTKDSGPGADSSHGFFLFSSILRDFATYKLIH